ncbi:MAG: FKBP-type peptidyl-prolyl cis-trans isomerase [Saprospiraceae bacterium]|nr:FKBP-type peptidyl-prolyl cis-trans isomerase [Saprospiraceae bacterium]
MTRFFFCCLMAGSLLMAAGCKDEDQGEIDRAIILNYIADNNLTAVEHESGIFHVITVPGSGGSPTLSSNVKVKYKGYLTDNVTFDETTGNNTIEFPLQNLIQGWQIAIPLLQKGGKGKFLIPSALGYGSNPPPGIPRNAVLVFDIELVDFN